MKRAEVEKALEHLTDDRRERAALVKAIAVIFAEHDEMKQRLIELGEVYDEVPIRWTATGERLVTDLQATIARFMGGK